MGLYLRGRIYRGEAHIWDVNWVTLLGGIYSGRILTGYIPNKYIIIDDKDPPWMTKAAKDKINFKNSLCKSKNFIELYNLAFDISEMIPTRKDEYYDYLPQKANDPDTSVKTYWSILKSFYKCTKVPLIPPLLVHNKTVSDFTEKANLFNDFFASQCTPITNQCLITNQ